MEKGTLLISYTGERYKVVQEVKNAQTFENMIMYQNEKDGEYLVATKPFFDKMVKVKGKYIPSFEIFPIGLYGGYKTLIQDLEVGTKFYVHNGAWDGEIIMREHEKCILYKGDVIENAFPIEEGKTLYITIKK